MTGNIPSSGGDINLGISTSKATTGFSNILGDVVFVLSGFVNPERGTLRSQAMKMGAQYQSDWNEDCTLLVCAFPNTPKYIQVKDCCGTIVSKEWISECYEQKKLIEIDSYLMHAGRPWRKNISQDSTPLSHIMSENLTEVSQSEKSRPSIPTKKNEPSNVRKIFSPSHVKEWSLSDLNATIFWLGSQPKKPGPSEIKSIASEGILTCLQDVIDCLKNKKNMSKMVEEWRFVPRVVEEIVKLGAGESGTGLVVTQDELLQQAEACKQVYEMAFNDSDGEKGKKRCDSDDETIEMTDEDIDDAYNRLVLSIHK